MRTTHLILPLLLACASCKGASTDAPATTTGGDPEPVLLRIASYNVLYSLAEKRAGVDPTRWADPDTLHHLQGLGADVLVLQETNEAWAAAITAALGPRYPRCIFHAPRRFLPEGLGVCSRFPMDGDTTFESPVGWFPAQQVVVHAPGGDVAILNVHLRPAVASPADWWQIHRETRPLRAQEIDRYLARLPRGIPAIIAGDFNENPDGDLFGALTAAGFESALPHAEETNVTWSWPGLSPPLGAQLDHVVYPGAAFALVSARIAMGGNSDHVPVVVTLERR